MTQNMVIYIQNMLLEGKYEVYHCTYNRALVVLGSADVDQHEEYCHQQSHSSGYLQEKSFGTRPALTWENLLYQLSSE